MTAMNKLDQVNERRQQLQNELRSLSEARRESANPALADLEKALLSELESIDRRIGQLKVYLDKCDDGPAAG